MKTFGDEKANYDETKRFCYFPNATYPGGKCVAYSIGSYNQWAFEEGFYAESNCLMQTFDCTVNATVPTPIRDRTTFHKTCIGATDKKSQDGNLFLTLPSINKLVNRGFGPDYFKMDIEVDRCLDV